MKLPKGAKKQVLNPTRWNRFKARIQAAWIVLIGKEAVIWAKTGSRGVFLCRSDARGMMEAHDIICGVLKDAQKQQELHQEATDNVEDLIKKIIDGEI